MIPPIRHRSHYSVGIPQRSALSWQHPHASRRTVHLYPPLLNLTPCRGNTRQYLPVLCTHRASRGKGRREERNRPSHHVRIPALLRRASKATNPLFSPRPRLLLTRSRSQSLLSRKYSPSRVQMLRPSLDQDLSSSLFRPLPTQYSSEHVT